mmetsp:Transcript_4064/g.11509  ORF Transcript_4064/g.11509 Transcript_4064/m.11509 type:complete len:308 (-) Transcript_4064:2032-2955(-)
MNSREASAPPRSLNSPASKSLPRRGLRTNVGRGPMESNASLAYLPPSSSIRTSDCSATSSISISSFLRMAFCFSKYASKSAFSASFSDGSSLVRPPPTAATERNKDSETSSGFTVDSGNFEVAPSVRVVSTSSVVDAVVVIVGTDFCFGLRVGRGPMVARIFSASTSPSWLITSSISYFNDALLPSSSLFVSLSVSLKPDFWRRSVSNCWNSNHPALIFSFSSVVRAPARWYMARSFCSSSVPRLYPPPLLLSLVVVVAAAGSSSTAVEASSTPALSASSSSFWKNGVFGGGGGGSKAFASSVYDSS